MTKPLRIAVADDEVDMRDYFERILPRLGHTVAAVAEELRRIDPGYFKVPPATAVTATAPPDQVASTP